ncbi:MAG: hypothetical protein K2Q14_05495 [Gammaproteobacteria bacterium]|nr:hypothetical protein [Gammaproteobacteria bacterium]
MDKLKNQLNECFSKMNKIHYNGKCLYPNCNNNAIQSHSQTKSVLKNICQESHVVGFNTNKIKLNKGGFFKKYGVNIASTFDGFCSTHDNSCFDLIEHFELNDMNDEQASLFLYRSICYEYVRKLTTLKRNMFLLNFLKKNEYSTEKIELLENFSRGISFFIDNELPFYKKQIEEILINKSYSNISYLFKVIHKKIPISISTLINPNFNEHSVKIGNIQPIFSLNIIPYEKHGLVIISWHNDFNEKMQQVNREFDQNFSKLINYLCFLESEDFYISPNFYESNIKKEKKYFLNALFNRFSEPYFGYNETKEIIKFD